MARPFALRHQLFVALVAPAVLAIAATAYLADVVARRSLEDALGDRLCSIAQSAATLVGPQVLLLARGDDESRSLRNARQKLAALTEATGVEGILVVRAPAQPGGPAEAIVDSNGVLRAGDEYTRARFDRAELEAVALGRSTASVLFEGPDGRPYKTGYAPLRDEAGAVGGYVGVRARASFHAAIDRLRHTMGGIALAGMALLALAAQLSARHVAVPLARLSEAARRIGEGKLDTAIPTGGPAEAQILGDTMRAMAASLAARDREMQLMLAGIAHEVRNPLGGIELFGGLLREDLEASDPRRKHVDKILKELRALTRVVNDFLDFARRARPELRPVELRALAGDVAALAAGDAQAAEVRVRTDVPEGLLVQADVDQLKRALLNLTRNAIQASPKGQEVTISAAISAEASAAISAEIAAPGSRAGVPLAPAPGARVEIAVRDHGPGIPPERAAEVFTPFFTTRQKGTGLGLALVKKVVDAHGGEVRVETAEGGGARMVIALPAAGLPPRDPA